MPGPFEILFVGGMCLLMVGVPIIIVLIVLAVNRRGGRIATPIFTPARTITLESRFTRTTARTAAVR